MPDELRLLRLLRPEAEPPEPDAVARSRAALAEETAAAAGRRRSRYARWLVPCFVVALFGAGGLAAAGLSDWWIGGEPPVRADEIVPHLGGTGSTPGETGMIDLGVRADLARTVARAPGAALVAAPADEGRQLCYLFVPDAGKFWTTCLGPRWAEEPFFDQSVIRRNGSTAWYVYGRVDAPEAKRVVLFEELTYPLAQHVDGHEAIPPMTAEIGDHGFFILRVDKPYWTPFDLAYTSLRTVDGDGTTIDRRCWFAGSSPSFPLSTGWSSGGPHFRTVKDRPWLEACPATGSLVDGATLKPAPRPRSADVSDFAGTDIFTGERLRLSDLHGAPVIMLVSRDLAFPMTMAHLLGELAVFAQRHPDVHVLVTVERPVSGQGRSGRAVRALRLGFPVLVSARPRNNAAAMELLRDAHGGFGVFAVALDSTGRIAGELVESGNHCYDVVGQEQLDDLLATASG